MAGHSKWNNIRIKKGRMDAKRGKLFTKLAKEILMAGRDGADPDNNFRLKVAISRAKDQNMPGSNIERLLDKLNGSTANDMEEITYEGYGPNGVAMLVETATDNRNRTAADVRLLFNKNDGSIGESGCVAWVFDRRGEISVADQGQDEEELLLAAMEAGALDLTHDGDTFTIYTEPTDLHAVRTGLEEQGIKIQSAEFTMLPKNTVELGRDEAKSVLKLFEALEDHDDVQNVYANFDIPDHILEELGDED